MAKDFLTDAEMGALEKSGSAKAFPAPKAPTMPADFISDDEMGKLEIAGKASRPTQTSALGAFGEHAANAATLGYLPHAQALVGKLMPNPSSSLDALMTYQGFKIEPQPDKSYVQSRDENIKRMAEQSAEHPIAAGAGTVAGAIGGGMLAGGAGAATKGLSLAQRLFQAGKAGAKIGAIANPGDVEGEISPLQAGARVQNAVIGGVAGTALQGGGEAIGQAAKAAAPYLKGKATEKAFKAMTGAGKKDFQMAKDKGLVDPVGQFGLDEKIVTPLATSSKIAGRVDALKEAAGKKIGAIIDDQSISGSTSGKNLALASMHDIDRAGIQKTPGMEGVADKIERMLETLASSGENLGLKELQGLRQGIDKSINFNKRIPEMNGTQSALYSMRDVIRNKMNDIANASGSVAKDELLKQNKVFANLSTVEKMLDKKLAAEASNRAVSLTDTIATVGGLATGRPGLAVLLGAMNKGGRTFGNSLMATGANRGAKIAQSAVGLPELIAGNATRLAAGSRAAIDTPFEITPEVSPDMLDIFKNAPQLIDNVKDPKLKAALEKAIRRAPSSK